MSVIIVERRILEKNDEIAGRNRALFAERGLFAVNLISSPGAGKTSLLERTLDALRTRVKAAVVEGDVQTDLDARRIARHQVPVVQIVTKGGCHLEAALVRDAIRHLDLDGVQVLFIENVGNLVCPAGFDLGESAKVVIVSAPEGEDKPLKYPEVFRNASAMILNKTDLLPHLDCDAGALKANALHVHPGLKIFETSCVTSEGIPAWCDWIAAQAGVGA